MKKTIMSVILVFMMIFAGCQTTQGDTVAGDETDGQAAESTQKEASDIGDETQAKGKFIEEKYDLPNEISNVFDVTKQENGDLLLLTDIGIYRSVDAGETWSDENIDMADYQEGGGGVSGGNIDIYGNIFIDYILPYTDEDPGTTHGGGYISKTGERSKVSLGWDGDNLDEVVYDYFLYDENKLIALDYGQNVVEIDLVTGEKKTISAANGMERVSIDFGGDMIILQTLDGPEYLEFDGTKAESAQALDQMLSEGIKLIKQLGWNESKMESSEDGTELYYCSRAGLYRHSLSTSMTELLLAGDTNTIGDTTVAPKGIAILDDYACFIVFGSESGEIRARKYSFSNQASIEAENDLKIYSLHDNANVRQAINIFQQDNQDTQISFEVGVSGDDAITVSDAKRTLVTNIMAGNGPDVLIMDGLSIEGFAENGLLADISSIVEEVNAAEELFENITNAFKTDEGMYAVPGRFTLPMLVGDLEDIQNIETVDDLVQAVKNLDADDADHILGLYDDNLLEMLYYLESSGWQQEDGTLDLAAVEQYLVHAGEIQKSETGNENRDYAANPDIFSKMFMNPWYPTGILYNNNRISTALSGSMMSFQAVISMRDYMDVSWKVFENEQGKVYIPSSTIALSSQTENEQAVNFIKEFLSCDAQYLTLEEGYPVNKAAFESIFTAWNPDEELSVGGGESGEFLTVGFITEEDRRIIRDLMESVSVPCEQDDIVKEMILEESSKYISGQSELEQAVSSIEQRVNLYLAE